MMVPDGDRQGEQYAQFRTGQWACRDSLSGWVALGLSGSHDLTQCESWTGAF